MDVREAGHWSGAASRVSQWTSIVKQQLRLSDFYHHLTSYILIFPLEMVVVVATKSRHDYLRLILLARITAGLLIVS